MADITIHGLDEEVLERLRLDAEATGQSVEVVALHILTNWYEHLERLYKFGESLAEIRTLRSPEPSARLEELRKKYGRQQRVESETQESVGIRQDQRADKVEE